MRLPLRTFSLILMALSAVFASADTLTVRTLFTEMPDTVIPYLSRNSRLDCIDFIDSKMKAEVTNEFGGKTELTALSDDSLSLRLNEACRLDILLLPTVQPVDSISQVIALVRNLNIEGRGQGVSVDYYSVHWRQLSDKPLLTETAERRMMKCLKQSNILNYIVEKINKD